MGKVTVYWWLARLGDGNRMNDYKRNWIRHRMTTLVTVIFRLPVESIFIWFRCYCDVYARISCVHEMRKRAARPPQFIRNRRSGIGQIRGGKRLSKTMMVIICFLSNTVDWPDGKTNVNDARPHGVMRRGKTTKIDIDLQTTRGAVV